MSDKSKSRGVDKKKMTSQMSEALRSLPSVDCVLDHEAVSEWLEGMPRTSVVQAVQAAIAEAREEILTGIANEPIDVESLVGSAERHLVERSIPSLRGVINATGIVLHTGLGRAPLCEAAMEAVMEAAGGYCNLEFDLETGSRGKRTSHVAELLVSVTGAESAAVVNNNAAATLLILQTFASGREVIVSRGQLIEIGGSFRLPDIMRASGATLREVGTTNRTRISDYEEAITDDTAVLLRAHTSNYRIVGFTEEASMTEISELAHRYDLIAVDDLGSGALFDLRRFGIPKEPTVRDSLAGGADLVCFSGDKLLGGPQCGIIAGKRDLVERLHRNPLMRTYRVDKMTLLALEATLRTCESPEDAIKAIPTLSMLAASVDDLAKRAQVLVEQLETAMPDEHFFVCSDVGFAGGGSLPGREVQTVVVQWTPTVASPDEMVAALQQTDPPVVARIRNDAICFDLRTLRESDLEPLVAAITSVVWE